MMRGTHNITLDKKEFIYLTLAFLERIWDYDHDNANVFVIIEKNQYVKPHFFFNNERLFEIVEKFLRNVNLENEYFYQILPLAKKPKFGRGKEKDVLVGKFLFVDLDYKSVVDNPKDIELRINEEHDHTLNGYFGYEGKIYYVNRPSLNKILDLCKEKIGKLPKFVIDSGAGYHLLFELNNYVDAKIIKKLNEIIAKLLGGDLQATDLCRIFRLPGTLNKKISRICNIIHVGEDKLNVNELINKYGVEEEKHTKIEKNENIEFNEKEFKFLNNEDKLKIINVIKEIYDVGNRHSVALYLSGVLCKTKIHILSTIELIKNLCEITGDEEIKDRISAVLYSYGKHGFDVEKYLDKIKEVVGFKPYGDKFEKEQIKGFSGLVELFEQKYGERAKSYISELNHIFNKINPRTKFEGYLFIDFSENEGYLIDYKEKIVYLAKKENRTFKSLRTILRAVPEKIIKYSNPFDKYAKYEIEFLSNVEEKIKIGPGYLPELIEEIKFFAITSKERNLRDVLNDIINFFDKTNRTEIKTHVEQKGFYLVDGKIVNVGYEIKQIDKEKLRDALILLNQIVDSYKSRNKVAYFIKNAVLLPFSYVIKQRGGMAKFIYLYGNSKTGKTTLGKVILYIWNVLENNKSGSFIDNVARLGHVISSTTFPVLINEPAGVFKNPEVVDTIKNAVENLFVRGKFLGKSYVHLPALANFIFTSNVVLPRDDALLRRFLIINFTLDEVIENEKINYFREKIESQFYKLKEIGNAIAYLVVNQNFELDSLKILKELYKLAELNEPDWLFLEYEEDVELPLLYDSFYIFQLIKKYIIDQHTKYLKTSKYIDGDLGEYTDYEPLEIGQMLRNLIIKQYLPGIFKISDFVYIDKTFFINVGLKEEEINLKNLASILGGEYTVKKIFGKPRRVICMKYTDFENNIIIRKKDAE